MNPTSYPKRTSSWILYGFAAVLMAATAYGQLFFNHGAITLTDNSNATPFPAKFTVPTNLVGTVSRVAVDLVGVTHGYPDDIDILLRSPLGSDVLLLSDAGGQNDIVSANLNIWPNAAVGLPDEGQIIGATPASPFTYLPTNFEAFGNDLFGGAITPAIVPPLSTSLNDFVGQAPGGEWRLFAQDDNIVDAGSIAEVRLIIWLTPIVTVTNTTLTIAEDPANPGTVVVGVADSDTALSALQFSAVSKNAAVIKDTGLTFGNFDSTGTNRTLNIRPELNAVGTADVEISVTDGITTIKNTVTVTVTNVNDAPTLIALQTGQTSFPQGSLSTNIAVHVTDIDSDVNALVLSASSSNPAIIAPHNVLFAGTGTNRTMRISGNGSATGTATVTIHVVDPGNLTNSLPINVTINSVSSAVAANTTAINIVDNAVGSPYPSQITVANVSGLVGRLTVSLVDFEHQNPDDIAVLLEGPTGVTSILMRAAGGNTSVVDGLLRFDETGADIPDASLVPISVVAPADYGTGSLPLPAPAAGAGYVNTLTAFNHTNPNGNWKLYVVDNAAGSTGRISGGWLLNIFPAPTISTIANRTVNEDTQNTEISFTVADQDGSVTNVVARSLDTTKVVLEAAATLTGNAGRFVLDTVTNANGVATIEVVAQDNTGGFTGTNTFTFTITAINDNPTQTVIPKQITRAGRPVGPISFTVGDVESDPSTLEVLPATSNNPKLLPPGSMVIGGSGPTRTITIFPAGNQAGQADITVTVRDPNGGSSQQTFDLTVDDAATPLFENPNPISIVDGAVASPYPSAISVANLVGTVTDVTVTLFGITEPQPDDLDIMLVGPTGTAVILMSDAGGGAANPLNAITLQFNDGAPGTLPDDGVIVSGIYQVSNFDVGTDFPFSGSPTPNGTTLGAFDGSNPNGQWRLFVVNDTAGPRGGSIAGGWQISIRTRPQVASIPDQTTPEDTVKRVSVVIGDAQPGVEYTITHSSAPSGTTTENIVKSITTTRSGNSLTLNITPLEDKFGENTVTLNVTDPANPPTSSSTFKLTVTSIDDAPRISDITDKTTPAATPISIPFTVFDVETSIATLDRSSSDTRLVPTSAISIANGAGPNDRILTILPEGVLTGESVITITATDTTGQKSSEAFKLTVTRNVSFANNARIDIRDNTTASPYPSVITVAGVQGDVSKVRVTLVGLRHTFPDDLDVLLVSPDGRKVLLMSDGGGGFVPNPAALRVSFAAGGTPLPDGGPLSETTYLPGDFNDPSQETLPSPAPARPYSTDLGSLDGVNPNGDWKLFVVDDTFSETGAIEAGWLLIFETGPTITQIGHQTINEDTVLTLPFSVNDQDTVAADLTVVTNIVKTAKPDLISKIEITTTGNDRTLTITPSANVFSASAAETNIIQLTVSDKSGNSAVSEFGLRVNPVNDAPTVRNLTGGTNLFEVNEDTVLTFTFEVADVDTANVRDTNVTANTLSPSIVPNNHIGISRASSTTVTVNVTNALNSFGTATFELLVNDFNATDAKTTTTNIVVKFKEVNDLPIIGTGSLTNRTVVAEGTTPVLEFSVEDVETPARNLSVTATSSEQSVIPNSNIVLGGSGGSRTIAMTALNATGSATIKVSVRDAGLDGVAGNADDGIKEHTFVVTVNAAPGFVFSNPTAINIRDNNSADPYGSPINVTGMRGSVSRVSVTLDGLTHTAPDDIDILLVSPTGEKVVLMSDAGGRNPVANLRLRFDQTGRSLPDDSPISTGTYQASNFGEGQDSFPNPAPAGPYASVLSAFNTPQNPNGTWTLFVVDDTTVDSGTIAFGWALTIETTPTIALDGSSLNQGTFEQWDEDGLGTISFVINDMVTTPLSNLELSASSSNPNLLPSGNVVFDRTAIGGSNIVATLTSAPNQFGSNNLTITVTRPTDRTVQSFTVPMNVLPINDQPTISRITKKTTVEDTPITFEILVNDVDHPLGEIWLEGSSDNVTLIKSAGVLINGVSNQLKGLSDTRIQITLVPELDRIGTANITLVASASNASTNRTETSFVFEVTDRNDPPTISEIGSQATPAGTTTDPVTFTVGDPEASNLTITATSTDQALVRDADISITPASPAPPGNRTLRITTQPGVTGRARITIRVKDAGNVEAVREFDMNVRPTRERVFSNNRKITIRDNGPADEYPSTVNVNGLNGNISKITVTLNGFYHTFPDDADILLVSPTGQKVVIFSDVGGDPDVTNLVVRLDDSASAVLEDNGPLATGTFKPRALDGSSDSFPSPAPAAPFGDTLAAFKGASPNGDWRLFVTDDTPSDSGHILNGWSIGVTTEPAILNLSDVTVPEDTDAVVNFTIAEESFAGTDFTFTGTSTNTLLVPSTPANIAFSGSGTNRTVTVKPRANANGQTEIAVVLSNADAQLVTNRFKVTFTPVADAPTITPVGDLTLVAGGISTVTGFDINDAETDKKNLRVNVTSSAPAVIAPESVIIIGNELSVVSRGNATGRVQITLTVTDESNLATSITFNVTVTAAQNPLFVNTSGVTVTDNANASPYPSPIAVTGVSGNVVGITVTLTELKHPFPDDLDILLVGPNGQGVVLMSDAGAGGNANAALSNARLTFDDNAPSKLPDNSDIPELGTFKPSNYEGADGFGPPAPTVTFLDTLTAAFQGTSANGTWSLFVKDDAQPDAGSIGSWMISIRTTAPTISDIPNQTVNEDTPKNVAFRVDDGNTAASALTVTTQIDASPVVSLNVVGTGNDRTLEITPLSNRFGTDVVTITVSDGTDTDTTTFEVVVVPVNDAPAIVGLSDTNTPANVPLDLTFEVSDEETAAETLELTATVADSSVGSANIFGTGASKMLVFTPNGVENVSTSVTVAVSDGETTTEKTFVVNVTQRLGPVISTIGDLTGSEDAIVLIPFSVNSARPATIVAQAVASNTALVTGVTVGGSGASLNLQIALAKDAFGVSDIEVSVTDAFGTDTESFTLTIPNSPDAPTLGAITDRATAEDVGVAIALAVADVDTLVADLAFSFSVSNPTLVSGIAFVKGETGVTANIQLGADQSGVAAISISVTDGTSIATSTFALTVTPVADLPTVAEIADVTGPESTPITVAVNVTDPDTALAQLVFGSTVSNSSLVQSVTFGTSGPNATATVTPFENATGTSTITVSVSDGTGTVFQSFDVTFTNADDDAPSLGPITDQQTGEDTPLVLTLDVGDPDTSLSNLTFFSATAGTAIVKDIRFEVTAENKVVMTVNLNTGATGTERIIISVSDGTSVSRRSFNLEVIDVDKAPTLAPINDQTTVEDIPVNLVLDVADPDTALSALTFSSTTSNSSLVSGVVFDTTGPVTAMVNLVTNAFGVGNVTITVSDAKSQVSRTFRVTVVGIGEPPVLTPIADQTYRGAGPVNITLDVTDPDNALSALTFFSAASGDGVVGTTTFTVTSPTTVTASIQLVSGKLGTDRVTITVSDGELVDRESFNLTIEAGVEEKPTLTASRAGNNLNISVEGTAGATYIIEGTADFSTWTEAARVTIDSDGVSDVQIPLAGHHRFVRARR